MISGKKESSRFALYLEFLFYFLSWKKVEIQVNHWSPILTSFSKYLNYHSKLGYIDLLVSALFFTIESKTRTLIKWQNVTVLFLFLRFFFLTLPLLKCRFGEAKKNICILVFSFDKSDNLAILVEFFRKNIITTEKFEFSAC